MTAAHRSADAVVSAAWLNQNLNTPGLRVLDASWHLPWVRRDARAEFAAARVPGARFFDIDIVSDRTTPLPHMLPAPDDFARAVETLGIGSEDRVVVYDSTGVFSAPRVWWMFRVFGHDRVQVLNGGFPAWREAGFPVETGGAKPAKPGGRFVPRFRPELVCGLAAVRENMTRGEFQLVDARSRPRFAGAEPELRPGVRPGHIPGSRNLPYTEILGPGGKFLLDPAEIAARFSAAGIDVRAPLATTCGSGISACILALGLYVAGRRDIAIYDGSWTEWGGAPDTPVETGPGLESGAESGAGKGAS